MDGSAVSRLGTGPRTALAVALLLAAVAPAAALDEPPGEKDALKACEKSLCTMVLDKSPKGDDLACPVQKTWAKSTLEGGESKGVSWGFGDARCKVDIKLERADIVAALTKPKHTVKIPAHQVTCVIEREGELKPLTAKVAPKLVFKNGQADKVWINLESIEGPADVKSTVWTAAKLEDTIGIFHRPMIKQINKFLYKQCPRRYGPEAALRERVERRKKRAEETAKDAPKSGVSKSEKASAEAAKPVAKPAPAKKEAAPAAKQASPAAKETPPPAAKQAAAP